MSFMGKEEEMDEKKLLEMEMTLEAAEKEAEVLTKEEWEAAINGEEEGNEPAGI